MSDLTQVFLSYEPQLTFDIRMTFENVKNFFAKTRVFGTMISLQGLYNYQP